MHPKSFVSNFWGAVHKSEKKNRNTPKKNVILYLKTKPFIFNYIRIIFERIKSLRHLV